jgi:hypothetical protein
MTTTTRQTIEDQNKREMQRQTKDADQGEDKQAFY